jgi:hypothetical protein
VGALIVLIALGLTRLSGRLDKKSQTDEKNQSTEKSPLAQ